MKKKIATFALLALSLVGLPVVAQAASDNDTTVKTECSKKECKKDGKKECKKDGKKECKKDGVACQKKNPFESLNLTDTQKEQIKQLREQCKADAQAAKAQKKDGDAATRPNFREGKKKYLEGLKSILTPEQYVTFLENSYLSQGPGKGKPMMGKKNPDGKQKMGKGPRDGKGPREGRGPRPEHK